MEVYFLKTWVYICDTSYFGFHLYLCSSFFNKKWTKSKLFASFWNVIDRTTSCDDPKWTNSGLNWTKQKMRKLKGWKWTSCNAHHAIGEVLAAHLEEFDGVRTLVFRERRRVSAHGPCGPAARFTVLSEREREIRSISAVWFNSFMIHDAALVNTSAQTPPNEEI